MKNIIESSENLTKIEKYLLTQSNAMIMVQTLENNTEIVVNRWCRYEDIDEEKDKTVSLLTILDDNNNVYCTQSATFRRSFADMVVLFDGEPFTIKKVSGTTKAGRDFVDCVLSI